MPWMLKDLADLSQKTTGLSNATTDFMNDAYRQVTASLGKTVGASQQGTAETNNSVTAPASRVTADGSSKISAGTAAVSATVTNTANATAENSAAAIGGTVASGIESANQTGEGTADGSNKTNESATKPTVGVTADGSNKTNDSVTAPASQVTADGSSKISAGTAAVSDTVTNTVDATAENSAAAIGGTVASGIESANQTTTKQTEGTRIKLLALDGENTVLFSCNALAEVTSVTKQAIELPDLQKILEAAKRGAEQGAEMYRAGKDKAFCPTVLRRPKAQQLEQQNEQNQSIEPSR